MTTFALIDCNNFYASCERLFRPDLQDKPIVVLSNNDGCVIARSNEAKACGIKMGEPYFKIKALSTKYNVQVFSSNYTLYGDMSKRVMSVIEQSWPHVEIYSIDEAFLDLSSMPHALHDEFCIRLQKTILKHTGIPTSIGIGATKTLAKIANRLCKKELKIPVFNIKEQMPFWLKRISVSGVWGVGRQLTKHLEKMNIKTAWDLASYDVHDLKKRFSVVLQRTAMELQGTSCLSLEDCEPRQSIMASRSFGVMQTELSSLKQAISMHCTKAYEKLRAQKLVAQCLNVFVYTNRHRPDLPQYCQSIDIAFINPTDDLRLMTHYACAGISKLFKTGFHYKKVGIRLDGLISKNQRQLDLFSQPTEEDIKKTEYLMQVYDRINAKFGRQIIRLAAEGFVKPWAMRAGLKSPAYTTQWKDLPKVKLG